MGKKGWKRVWKMTGTSANAVLPTVAAVLRVSLSLSLLCCENA